MLRNQVFERLIITLNILLTRLHVYIYYPVFSNGDKIEKNEMGGAYSAYGEEERRIQGFGGRTWGKETTWKTQA